MADPHITIQNQPAQVYYTVGATPDDEFEIPFVFFDEEDILYYKDNIRQTSGFSVTGNPGNEGGFDGGTLNLDTPVSNVDVAIIRNVEVQRTTDFPIAGPFNINQLNTDLDRIFAIVQELEDELGITVKLDLSQQNLNINVQLPGPVAGNVIGWNDAGNGVVNLTGNETTNVFINNVITQALAEAQAILDAYEAITQNVTISTAFPSGGNDGDIWLKVPA